MNKYLILFLSNEYSYISFSAITMSIATLYIASNFFDYKFSLKEIILASTILFSIYILFVIFFHKFFVISFFMPIFIFLKYKKQNFILFKTIFLIIYLIFFRKLTELIIVFIFFLFKLNTDYLFPWLGNILLFIIIVISTFKLNLVIKNLICNFYKYKNYKKIITSLLFFILVTYNFIAIYSKIKNDDVGVYYLALSSVLGLCILFLIISNILRENLKVSFKNKLENEKIIQQKKHIESLEENNNEIRKFKHDFTNIMLSLSGYINSEEIDVIALKKYFNSHVLSLKEKIDVTNSTALSHLGNIKNKPLKSLITNKILIALNYNIDIEINIENKISNVFTQEIQLTRIVGILLDNAIEACRELNTDRIIKINILRINKTIDISITNTFNNENFSIGKFQKNGFSTKGKNRGLGLSIAKEIVSKYNLLLNTEIYNNFFTQNLTIEGDFYENNNMRR